MASGILARLLVGFQTFSVFVRGIRLALSALILPQSDARHVAGDAAAHNLDPRIALDRALREGNLRFWRMADTAPIMIWMSDAEGGCIYFNQPWLEFRGRTLQEEFGDGWAEGVHPDDLAACLRIYRAAIKTQTAFEMEYRLRRADGSYRWILDKGTPRFRRDGSVGGFVGACTDVTPLKQAEAALRESERRFRALYHGITDALFVHKVGDDGSVSQFLEVNDVACQRLGYTRDELLAMTPADIDETDNDVDIVGLTKRVAAGEDVTFEQGHIAKDGHPIPVEIHAKSFELEGQPAVISIVRDITDRKRAEAQAAREAERAEVLLRMANRLSGYSTLDELLSAVCEESRQALGLPGSVVLLHQAESREFTLAQSSGLSDSCRNALRPATYEAFRRLTREEVFVISDATLGLDAVDGALCGEQGVWGLVGARIVYKDELLGCLIVYTADKSDPLGPNELALLRGIADQAGQGIISARLFDQLRSSQQRLGDLSKRLVRAQEVERRHLARELHDDIGQVLTMIKLNLQSIDRDALEIQAAESLQASLVAVDDAIQRVRHLSRDLRPSVLDDLGLVPALRWFVDQQAQQASFEAVFRADVLEGRLPSNLENAYFRIVQEAMTNVVRHSRAESVFVELCREGDALILTIWDDGVGFDLDRTLLGVAEGRSLGLLNMRERALLIGGSFDVRSEPGEGTEITVRAPLTASSGMPTIEPMGADVRSFD